MLKLELNEKVDLLVSNDVNGDVFAVVKQGDNQEERVLLSIREEFSAEIKLVSSLKGVNMFSYGLPNILFEVEFENGDKQSIRLTRAFIY